MSYRGTPGGVRYTAGRGRSRPSRDVRVVSTVAHREPLGVAHMEPVWRRDRIPDMTVVALPPMQRWCRAAAHRDAPHSPAIDSTWARWPVGARGWWRRPADAMSENHAGPSSLRVRCRRRADERSPALDRGRPVPP